MADNEIFGRNQVMRAILGIDEPQNKFLEISKQQRLIRNKLREASLDEDQIKDLIELVNEFLYDLNRKLRENEEQSDSRVPLISR
jgi:hypothetical protein